MPLVGGGEGVGGGPAVEGLRVLLEGRLPGLAGGRGEQGGGDPAQGLVVGAVTGLVADDEVGSQAAHDGGVGEADVADRGDLGQPGGGPVVGQGAVGGVQGGPHRGDAERHRGVERGGAEDDDARPGGRGGRGGRTVDGEGGGAGAGAEGGAAESGEQGPAGEPGRDLTGHREPLGHRRRPSKMCRLCP